MNSRITATLMNNRRQPQTLLRLEKVERFMIAPPQIRAVGPPVNVNRYRIGRLFASWAQIVVENLAMGQRLIPHF